MDDKYLSIITNFGCHYSCPECIVRNNKLKMTPTEEHSSYMQLEHVLKNECNDCNWVSVSGGGDPLYHWWEHQAWWTGFFSVCKELGRKIELHTSYYDFDHDDGILMFPFEQFDRVVYHLHCAEELYKICRRGKEIVRVVFVVDDSMDEYEVSKISAIVQESDDIDELTFRQYVDENYKETYYLHDLLLAGHKKAWWYVTQCDYNTYYHNGKLYTKYTDIFDSEVASYEKHKDLLLAACASAVSFLSLDDIFEKLLRHISLVQMATGSISSLYGRVSELALSVSVALSLAIGAVVYILFKN